MKSAIWKYSLLLVSEQELRMVKGAKILSCQMQGDDPCLWAMVEPGKVESEPRTIVMVGTGHPMPDGDMAFLDTVQVGAYVFHFFEKR